MKKITLVICILFSTSSFCQKISYKDLIGNWKSTDTADHVPMVEFKFIDSSHVIQLFSMMGTVLADTLAYALNNSFSLTMIHLTGKSNENEKIDESWFVKIINRDTLKIQGKNDGSKPIKWDENETLNNTGTMIRVKDPQ